MSRKRNTPAALALNGLDVCVVDIHSSDNHMTIDLDDTANDEQKREAQLIHHIQSQSAASATLICRAVDQYDGPQPLELP